MRPNRSFRQRLALTFLPACMLALGAATTAQAQIIYPAKFVCGFETGLIPFLTGDNTFQPGPDSYEMFKPGNYATVVNMWNRLNIQQAVLTAAVVTFEDAAGNVFSFAAPLPIQFIAPLGALRYHCGHIAAAINALLNPPDSAKDVDAVYTYAAEHGFALYLFLGSSGAFTGTNLQSFAETLSTLFSRLDFGEGGPLEAIGGAGAGGLGLGASIDVEPIDPVDLTNPNAPTIGPAAPMPTISPNTNKVQPTLEQRQATFNAYLGIEQ